MKIAKNSRPQEGHGHVEIHRLPPSAVRIPASSSALRIVKRGIPGGVLYLVLGLRIF